MAVLVAMSAVSPLALNIYVPSMPGMVGAFETSATMVQLTLSLYLASIAVTQLIIGPLSDVYGRRPVVLYGLVLFIIGTLICRFAPTIDTLIMGRVIQGAGGCTGLVLARSVVRDLYGREKSASMIGYVTMGMAVAPMIAPAIGGILDGLYGWQSGFDLMILIGVLVLAATVADLNETNQNRKPNLGLRQTVASYRTLGRYPAFWAFAATSSFSTAVFFSFLGGAPFVVTDVLDMTPTEYGFFFIMVAGGYIVGNFLSGRFAERNGIVTMMLAGNSLSIVAVSAIGIGFALEVHHPLTLFGPMFVSGIANGLTLPSAIAGAVSVRTDLAGSAAGLSGSLQVGAGAIASAIVGALIGAGTFGPTVWPLVVCMGCASALAFVSGLLCLPFRQQLPD